VRFTIPENPLTLETVRLAVAEEPCERVMEIALATIVKSWGGGDTITRVLALGEKVFHYNPSGSS